MQITPQQVSQLRFDKGDGLLPAIVQHALSGQVLMQGYMNQAALMTSFDTGKVTFFSRSKQRLWCKGESSGHVLQLQQVFSDCDQDSLLILALPQGPTCHTGCQSCFDAEGTDHSPSAQALLGQLQATISARKGADPGASYTAQLFAEGHKRIAQKVGEEGVEVALAGVAGDDAELLNESADLLFHLLTLLASRDLTLEQVLAVLAARQRPAPAHGDA